MKTLQLTGWNEGMMAVSLIRALKDHAHLPLPLAKSEVERLLDGHRVQLQFDSQEEREAFRSLALSIGAQCTD
jgi:hypothetical protein